MSAKTNNIELTHGEKILFPDSGITKGDVVKYYEQIADYILPFLKDRPLTMRRYPNGIEDEGFFQKNAPDNIPKWVKTAAVKKKDGWLKQIICNTRDTLIYLANLYVIEFHVTLSSIDKLNIPNKIVFDLDPSGDKFQSVVKGALELRKLLVDQFGIQPYVMTTGSRGLHVVVPLEPVHDFEVVRTFCKKTARQLCDRYPEEFTTEIRKEKRHGRLYIDCLRNAYSQTSVAPFSLRARKGAPVATPLKWIELQDPNLNARIYSIETIFERLLMQDDIWNSFGAKTFTFR
ncbi:MAG: non-homologous end-joining DNA ligase [Eudoraea sp.]|nr:non-homologous end-joining DNA ligase [Eudoraea sp.]